MTYTINKTNGGILTQIEDQTIDETTDLKLFGRRRADYGDLLNENFVSLLENFAHDEEPANPLAGQIWYDTGQSNVKYWTGTTWRLIGGVIVSATEPPPGEIGDMWYNIGGATKTLHAFDGSSWALIGPDSGAITGAIGLTIEDSLAAEHDVIELRVATGVGFTYEVVGIVSLDTAFTPSPAITGFTTIKPGLNISSTVSGAKLHGTATNSDALGGIAAANYLRNDQDGSIAGSLSISDDDGLVVGLNDDFTVNILGTTANIENDTVSGDLQFRNTNVLDPATAITIDGDTNDVTIHGDLTILGSLVGFDVPVTSVNGYTGDVVLDTDDVAQGATNLYVTTTNVNNAGAVMNADTTTAAMLFVLDEDAMGSNSSTKLATQQSIKAYVDTQISTVDTPVAVVERTSITSGLNIVADTHLSSENGYNIVSVSLDGANINIDEDTLPNMGVRTVKYVVTENTSPDTYSLRVRDNANTELHYLYSPGDYVEYHYDGTDRTLTGHRYTYYSRAVSNAVQSFATTTTSLIWFPGTPTQIGECFDNTAHTFTAPEDGLYAFHLHGIFYNTVASVSSSVSAYMRVNEGGYVQVDDKTPKDHNNASILGTYVVQLAKNDYVRAYFLTETTNTKLASGATFTGYLVRTS